MSKEQEIKQKEKEIDELYRPYEDLTKLPDRSKEETKEMNDLDRQIKQKQGELDDLRMNVQGQGLTKPIDKTKLKAKVNK